MIPGEILAQAGEIDLHEGRSVLRLRVANTGDRPIQVGSHFHFFETNRALRFKRGKAFGMRLGIPAGTAVRFEPGEEKDVDLIPFGGKRKCRGFNGLSQGGTRAQAMARARKRGYL